MKGIKKDFKQLQWETVRLFQAELNEEILKTIREYKVKLPFELVINSSEIENENGNNFTIAVICDIETNLALMVLITQYDDENKKEIVSPLYIQRFKD